MISKKTYNSFNPKTKNDLMVDVVVIHKFRNDGKTFLKWFKEDDCDKRNNNIFFETKNCVSKSLAKNCKHEYKTHCWQLSGPLSDKLEQSIDKQKWMDNDFYISIFDVFLLKLKNKKNKFIKNLKERFQYKP